MGTKIAELWGWGRLIAAIGFLAGAWVFRPWRQALAETILFVVINLIIDVIILVRGLKKDE